MRQLFEVKNLVQGESSQFAIFFGLFSLSS